MSAHPTVATTPSASPYYRSTPTAASSSSRRSCCRSCSRRGASRPCSTCSSLERESAHTISVAEGRNETMRGAGITPHHAREGPRSPVAGGKERLHIGVGPHLAALDVEHLDLDAVADAAQDGESNVVEAHGVDEVARVHVGIELGHLLAGVQVADL